MILYHGSEVIVEKPSYGYGRKENDYGQGFYCTEDMELAREWACQSLNGGFVNIYELDTNRLRIYEIGSRDIMTWLAILLSNRIVRFSSPLEKHIAQYITDNFYPDISGYDIIKGYRADDSYFTIARSFLSNTITLEQLGTAMGFGQLGMQLCLKSKKAFDRIIFTGSETVDSSIYHPRWIERDERAREDFYSLLEVSAADNIYARDILNRRMTADELRL